jgi:dipeptidyl aminopeptidase/acylaminoacyl peptidase
MSVDGGKPEKVLEGGSGGVYAPPGYLLYLDGNVNAPRRRLLARRFDPASRRVSGDALLVMDDVDATNFGYANVASSPQGTLVVQHWADVHTRLEWRDRGGKLSAVAADDLSNGLELSLAPDGHHIAFDNANPPDLYVVDLDGGVPARLTFEEKQVNNLVWSPDGRRIAFARLLSSGRWDTYVKNADGTGPDSLLLRGPGLFAFPASWSPDGRWLLASIADVHGLFSFWKVPMDGGAMELYERTASGAVFGKLSPDGHWAATIATESNNRNALYVQSFPTPGARYQIAVENPTKAFWNPRGGELIVVEQGGRVVSVPVSTDGGFRQSAARRLFQTRRDEIVQGVSADGQRILTTIVLDVSNLISLEVVMGWEGLLKGR